MRSLAILLIFFSLVMMTPVASWAQPRGPGYYQGVPYGHFCPGRRWGPYGIRRPVNTADEAKEVIETYFSSLGQKVTIGKIEERKRYFEADILGPDGSLADKVIVDKRAGRIRSIY